MKVKPLLDEEAAREFVNLVFRLYSGDDGTERLEAWNELVRRLKADARGRADRFPWRDVDDDFLVELADEWRKSVEERFRFLGPNGDELTKPAKPPCFYGHFLVMLGCDEVNKRSALRTVLFLDAAIPHVEDELNPRLRGRAGFNLVALKLGEDDNARLALKRLRRVNYKEGLLPFGWRIEDVEQEHDSIAWGLTQTEKRLNAEPAELFRRALAGKLEDLATFRIRNRLSNVYRSIERHTPDRGFEEPIEARPESPVWPTVEEELIYSELFALLKDKASPLEVELMQHAEGGHTIPETAEKMGISKSTARVLLHRLKKKATD